MFLFFKFRLAVWKAVLFSMIFAMSLIFIFSYLAGASASRATNAKVSQVFSSFAT
jgi:hypothetical protein